MTILFYLLAAHALCDYPLQGDFLARGKNHTAPLPGIPWYQCLAAHALIHGAAVALITGSVWFGLIETAMHAITDWSKCQGWISFNQDQSVHVIMKVAFALLLFVK